MQCYKNITRATNFFKINRFKLNSSYQSISCFKETDTFGHLGSLGFTISKTLIEAEEKWRHIYKFYSLLLSNLFKQFTLIQISWESLTLLLCWFQEIFMLYLIFHWYHFHHHVKLRAMIVKDVKSYQFL